MTTVNQGPKQKKDNSRITTSLVLIAFIIPFFVLAGLTQGENPIIPWGYNYFFVTGLSIAFFYGIYEAIRFCTTNEIAKQEENKRIVIASLLFGLTFLFFEISFLTIQPTYIREIEHTLFITMILLVISMLIWFTSNSTSEIDFKDLAIPFVMITLLMMYLMSITVLTIVFGAQTFFFFTLTIVMTDVMAYVGGKKFGKTKAFPKVSPNKTVEGLVTGIVSALVFAVIFFWAVIYTTKSSISSFADPSFHLYLLLVIVIFTVAIAPLGDLLFSKIKRSYDKKDFSNLLPGHGGLFDRIDSHIVATTLSTLLMFVIFMA